MYENDECRIFTKDYLSKLPFSVSTDKVNQFIDELLADNKACIFSHHWLERTITKDALSNLPDYMHDFRANDELLLSKDIFFRKIRM